MSICYRSDRAPQLRKLQFQLHYLLWVRLTNLFLLYTTRTTQVLVLDRILVLLAFARNRQHFDCGCELFDVTILPMAEHAPAHEGTLLRLTQIQIHMTWLSKLSWHPWRSIFLATSITYKSTGDKIADCQPVSGSLPQDRSMHGYSI